MSRSEITSLERERIDISYRTGRRLTEAELRQQLNRERAWTYRAEVKETNVRR